MVQIHSPAPFDSADKLPHSSFEPEAQDRRVVNHLVFRHLFLRTPGFVLNRMSLSEQSESKTPWYVYIARANTGRFYVGITIGPQKRIVDHNSGLGSKFARDQGPFTLVYISSKFNSKSEARKREIQLKGWSRIKKQKLIDGTWH